MSNNWVEELRFYFSERKKYQNHKINDDSVVDIKCEISETASIGDIISINNFDNLHNGKYKVLDNKNNKLKLGLVELEENDRN